jgi:hypothetical protein
MSETATNPRSRGGTVGASGRRRQLQLARESEAERRALADRIAAALGRPLTAIDEVAISAIAATSIRADRLRATGRSDHAERQLLTQMFRATGLRPALTVPQKDPCTDWAQYLSDDAAAGSEVDA